MGAVRRKPPALKRQQDEINRKAILWVAGAFAAVVIILSVLIIVNG
ncbi:hypothetical protein [Thermobacillus sp. ZCTH02-B1]|nr:hypothetical protein [Thermobacillus sp. ZCTH02-B1]